MLWAGELFFRGYSKKGLDLYKKKRVLGFSRTDDSAIARVADGRNYQVTVWYRDEKLAGELEKADSLGN